jgi:hypothetical protein
VLPRLLLTRRHPVLPLRLGYETLCITHRGKYLDFLIPCEGEGNYVVIIPYQGVYTDTKLVEPITWGNALSVDVYSLFNNELALYEVVIRDGKASYIRYRINEEFLRGIGISGDGVDDVLRAAETVLRNYVKSSFMIYTAYLKLVSNGGIKFPEYKEYVRGRVRVYVRDGIVIIKEVSGYEVKVSLVSTIEAVDQFVEAVISLIRSSRIINDIRLGRIGHSIRTILDIFMPNIVLIRK